MAAATSRPMSCGVDEFNQLFTQVITIPDKEGTDRSVELRLAPEKVRESAEALLARCKERYTHYKKSDADLEHLGEDIQMLQARVGALAAVVAAVDDVYAQVVEMLKNADVVSRTDADRTIKIIGDVEPTFRALKDKTDIISRDYLKKGWVFWYARDYIDALVAMQKA